MPEMTLEMQQAMAQALTRARHYLIVNFPDEGEHCSASCLRAASLTCRAIPMRTGAVQWHQADSSTAPAAEPTAKIQLAYVQAPFHASEDNGQG